MKNIFIFYIYKLRLNKRMQIKVLMLQLVSVPSGKKVPPRKGISEQLVIKNIGLRQKSQDHV